MFSIGIVHLVRNGNSLSALELFINSYHAHPAGVEHELVLLLKGFETEIIPDPIREVLGETTYQTRFLPDVGFDLGAYFSVSALLQHQYLCFLNSYSQILCNDWLLHLQNALQRPHVGLVGATASYQSHFNSYLYLLAHPTPDVRPARSWLKRLGGHYLRKKHLAYYRKNFPPYPNYHLRTNAFMLERSLLLSLRQRPFRTKADALAFESDRYSLTRQVMARNLEVLVVGCDGQHYSKEQWAQSHTFCSGAQENLLVADNQSQLYSLAGATGRRELSRRTWEALA